MVTDMPRIGGVGAHPILILGVILFIIPFFGRAIGWDIPGFVSWLAVGVIVYGGYKSIDRNTER